MSDLPLYADEGVNGTVVRGLQRLGWNVRRAIDVHPEGTPDEVHFESAAEMGCCLVSADQDMLKIAARWRKERKQFPGLFYLVPGKYRRVGDILRAFAAAEIELRAKSSVGWVKFL